MPRIVSLQNAFVGGEISPRLFGRSDIQKYRIAARSLENWILTPQGTLVRRSGTRYVAPAKGLDSARLIPFIFSDQQAYVIELCHCTARFYRNEGQLVHATLSGIRAAQDVNVGTDEITSVGHGYGHGDGPVRISTDDTLPTGLVAGTNYYIQLAQSVSFAASAVGATTDEISVVAHGFAEEMGPFRLQTTGTLPGNTNFETDYYIRLTAVSDPVNFFELATSPGGSAVNITSQGTGTHTLTPTFEYLRDKFRLGSSPSGSIVNITAAGSGLHTLTPLDPQPVEVALPYLQSEIDTLSYAQSADVLYLVHPNHPPRKIERWSPHGFTIREIDFVDGPYLSENPDSTHTMAPSAATGNGITITSSTGFFKGTDVGRLIRIKNGAHWGYAKIVSVAPKSFTDAAIAKATILSVDTVAEEVTTSAPHGMSTGEPVRLTGSLPTTLSTGVTYYVNAVAANRLTFHTTVADALAGTAPVDLTSTTTGGTITSSVIDITAHGYTGGEGPLTLTNIGGALPGGLSAGTTYYIGYVDANSFTLRDARGGALVPIETAAGGGTHLLNGDDLPQTTAIANVKAAFAGTGANAAWRMGAWGAAENLGYPRAVTFHEQRLWFSSNPGAPQTLYGSKSADFEAFSPTGDLTGTASDLDDTVDDDNAVTFTLGSNQVNVIQWLSPVRTLVLGTSSANWTAQAATLSEAITPTNLQIIRSSAHGSLHILPVVVDDRVIYISDTRRKLFGLGYSFQNDAYLAEDLTLIAEHISKGGFQDLGYAHEPWSMLWCPRADGEVATLTLIREQEVLGWARQLLGGVDAKVLSVAVIPSPDGDASGVGRPNRSHDQVWMLVERTVGGVSVRWVEFLEDHFDTGDGDAMEDAFFVDAGLTYNGAPTTSVAVAHLAGETVDVLADGKPLLAQTVSGGGTLTLAEAASKVHVGYRQASELRTLRLSVESPEGTGQVDLGRIDHVILRLYETLGGWVGPNATDLTEIREFQIPEDQPLDVLPPLFSDDLEVDFDAPWETYGEMVVRQIDPLPMTLTAIAARLSKSQRGNRAR